jgi:hypothetical protein
MGAAVAAEDGGGNAYAEAKVPTVRPNDGAKHSDVRASVVVDLTRRRSA